MSTRFSYKTKGHLSQKELEGLHKLCREEEDVKWATLNSDKELSDYYHKLLVYFKVNKFKLFEANETLLDRYKEYKDKYGPLSIDDIENLNITVKSEKIRYASEILEGIPEAAGVYIITFPNGKKYLGQSKNIKRRLSKHFSYLSNYLNYKNPPEWYGVCLKDNPGLQLEKVFIEFIAAKNCKEIESEMLRGIEDRTQYYNSDFY